MDFEQNDPDCEISDADFEQMVREAEQASCQLLHRSIGRKRFGLIRTFQVPLPEITVNELAAHFEYVSFMARDTIRNT
jgi:hypothetical protein